MKISVLMQTYLGQYPNCADKREKRFKFAVNSFLKQTFKDCELVIISDGCDKTDEITKKYFGSNKKIKLIRVERNRIFSGIPQNAGIESANGDLICYLDSDDFIGENHLEIIVSQFDPKKIDFAYFNDYCYNGNNCFKRRSTKIPEKNKTKMVAGTCSIVHKRELPVKWDSGYGQDHRFIEKMQKKFKFTKFKKDPQYFVCHVPIPGKMFDIDNPNYCYL